MIRTTATILVVFLLSGCSAMFAPAEKSPDQLRAMSISDLLNDVSGFRIFKPSAAYLGTLTSYTSDRIAANYKAEGIEGRDGFLVAAERGEVSNGMNQWEVVLAWGFPVDRSDSQSTYGATSHWHWGASSTTWGKSVSFRDGLVQWWSVDKK